MKTIARILPLALAAILAGMAVSSSHSTTDTGPISGGQATLSERSPASNSSAVAPTEKSG